MADTVFIDKRFDFSNTELQALGEDLAQALTELSDVADRRKAAMDEFKSEAGLIEKRISTFRQHLCDKFKIEPVLCTVRLDPERGMKEFINAVTHEVEKEEPMSNDDYTLFEGMDEPSINVVGGL